MAVAVRELHWLYVRRLLHTLYIHNMPGENYPTKKLASKTAINQMLSHRNVESYQCATLIRIHPPF